MKKEGREK